MKTLIDELKKGVGDLQTAFKQCHSQICRLVEEFETYIVYMGTKDPNWRFWGEFVTENCFAYVSLFCAIRSGNWDLRVAALKKMAPLFCALDRPIYRRLVPQHLADYITRRGAAVVEDGWIQCQHNGKFLAFSRPR